MSLLILSRRKGKRVRVSRLTSSLFVSLHSGGTTTISTATSRPSLLVSPFFLFSLGSHFILQGFHRLSFVLLFCSASQSDQTFTFFSKFFLSYLPSSIPPFWIYDHPSIGSRFRRWLLPPRRVENDRARTVERESSR